MAFERLRPGWPSSRRLAAFVAGMAVLWVVVGSPLSTLRSPLSSRSSRFFPRGAGGADVGEISHPAARADKECFNYVKVQGGKFVSTLGQPGKPWICFNEKDPNVDNPQFLSFATG